jgi:hypothetical protein
MYPSDSCEANYDCYVEVGRPQLVRSEFCIRHFCLERPLDSNVFLQTSIVQTTTTKKWADQSWSEVRSCTGRVVEKFVILLLCWLGECYMLDSSSTHLQKRTNFFRLLLLLPPPSPSGRMSPPPLSGKRPLPNGPRPRRHPPRRPSGSQRKRHQPRQVKATDECLDLLRRPRLLGLKSHLQLRNTPGPLLLPRHQLQSTPGLLRKFRTEGILSTR